MLRVLLVFLGLAAVGIAGAWLADHPGQISMQWGGRLIETSTAVAWAALLLLLVVVAAIYRFWRWLLSSPLAPTTRVSPATATELPNSSPAPALDALR